MKSANECSIEIRCDAGHTVAVSSSHVVHRQASEGPSSPLARTLIAGVTCTCRNKDACLSKSEGENPGSPQEPFFQVDIVMLAVGHRALEPR